MFANVIRYPLHGILSLCMFPCDGSYFMRKLCYYYYSAIVCNSSCTGLNQCYGPMANQCCSYNDGGNCTDDCGVNREGNSTFHCVCSNFWTGPDCDGMLQNLGKLMQLVIQVSRRRLTHRG